MRCSAIIALVAVPLFFYSYSSAQKGKIDSLKKILTSLNDTETFRAVPWDAGDGLSVNSVSCMLKDVNGFLWVGTPTGLNRFDGGHFVAYFSDKNKRGAIDDDRIIAMVEDSLHNIWIATLSGLSRYDIKADTFTHVASLKNRAVTYPYTVPFGATKDEVFCIEMKSRLSAFNIYSFKRRVIVEHFQNDWDDNFPTLSHSILDEKNGCVWMVTKAGVLKLALSTGKEEEYSFLCRRKVKYEGYRHYLSALCFDKKRSLIWLSTSDRLVEFNVNNKLFHFLDKFDEIVNVKLTGHFDFYNSGLGIGIDLKGRVWIGTEPRGILIYDPESNALTTPSITDIEYNASQNLSHLSKKPFNVNNLDPAYFAQDGIIWLTGHNPALCQLTSFTPAVTQYKADPADPHSLSYSGQSVEIKDLVYADGSAAGTEVVLKIPVVDN